MLIGRDGGVVWCGVVWCGWGTLRLDIVVGLIISRGC